MKSVSYYTINITLLFNQSFNGSLSVALQIRKVYPKIKDLKNRQKKKERRLKCKKYSVNTVKQKKEKELEKKKKTDFQKYFNYQNALK